MEENGTENVVLLLTPPPPPFPPNAKKTPLTELPDPGQH